MMQRLPSAPACRRIAGVDTFSFVIAGLDPAIHCAEARDVNVETEPGRSVDARVKPGHDERVGINIPAIPFRAIAP